MSVNAVTSAFSSYAQQATAGGTTSKTSALATAVDEATETKATTIKEAQSGDPVARKKLLKLQAKEQQQQATEAKPASEPGKGTAVDQKA